MKLTDQRKNLGPRPPKLPKFLEFVLFHPFPIGFGNKKKAREFLDKALAQNPNGIEPNYFMADFLVHTGDYKSALKYVTAAEAAPSRPERPIAD